MTNWYQSSKSSAMADGTRIKSFEDSIRKVEVLLLQLQQIKAIHESNKRIEEQHQQLEKQKLIQPNLGANLGGTSSDNQYHHETPLRESLQEHSSLEAWSFVTSTQDFTTESDKQYEEQKQINESQSRQDEIEKSTKDIASYPQIVKEFVDEQRNQRLDFAIVDELQTFQEGSEAQCHGNTEEPRICHKPSKVIPDSLPIITVEAALEKVVEGDDFCFVDQWRTDARLRKISDLGIVSIGLLKIPFEYQVFVENPAHGRELQNRIGKILESFTVAYNLFDEMPNRGVNMNEFSVQLGNVYLTTDTSNLIFDPGGGGLIRDCTTEGNGAYKTRMGKMIWKFESSVADMVLVRKLGFEFGISCKRSSFLKHDVMDCYLGLVKDIPISMPYDRGKEVLFSPFSCFWEVIAANPCIEVATKSIRVFDPGGDCPLLLRGNMLRISSVRGKNTIILAFDPGGFWIWLKIVKV